VLLTERPGHATELARRAARDGVAVVIAVGGDGTVNEVAAGVLGTSAALAALPAGTGNDFAREIGMPRSWRRAVAALPRARRRLIDVGLANGRLFVQSAGAGLDGYVLQLRARGRRLARPLMYPMCTIQGLLTYRPAAMTFTLDGERWTQRALTVAVANGHAYGGGVQIAPGALLDDGRFDVAVVGDLSRLDALRTFPLFYRGAQTGHPKIALRRGVRLLVEADQPLAVHADGTLQGTTPVEFTIQPGALPVLALR
jgi:YegS/Rv2252/BmrU family lipid kinase